MASQHKCYNITTEVLPNHQHQSDIEIMNFEKLNYEEERIKSFSSWPVHYPVDPCRLAKAGFYYTGNEDEVVCFSCEGHVKNWNYGDIVLKKHSDLYPNCDFINNLSNNVPLVKTSSRSKAVPLDPENKDGVNKNYANSNVVNYSKMKLESERLKTFAGKWPLPYVNIEDLAHAGFFYMGTDDKVQCPFCKGVKQNWEVGSVPLKEHLKLFPWCDYLSERITNVKKGPLWFQSSSEDVCGNMKKTDSNPNMSSPKLFDNSQQLTNLEDLGVHLHKGPVHPQQASLMARLRSFVSWPSNAPVSKEDLAAAGFFYIGIGDRTICFHCNGGLCSWEDGDDPWVEHARWFSTCDFLRLNRGNDFIKSCLMKDPSKMFADPPKMPEENVSPDGISTEPLLKKVDEAMKSNLVKYVLETEIFPPYIVRAAILLQIKKTGKSFSDIDDLCVASSYLKEEMENESFEIKKPIKTEDLNIRPSISESFTASDASPVMNNMQPRSPNPTESTSGNNLINAGNPEKCNVLQDDESKDACLCKICMDKEVGVVFLPCGHLPACTICAPALKHCPMCRKPIQATVRCYLS